ncbi:hypothetical protein BJX66DRAFT_60687 [Aspergillus keveii]|uniref:Uncharacterized protein n=1 Tax=Aspergillus keveii TaxID=714993 RepID=A0ABR4FQS9_9EURO
MFIKTWHPRKRPNQRKHYPRGLQATVAFMTVRALLNQATLDASPTPSEAKCRAGLSGQKGYSINIMSATAVPCAARCCRSCRICLIQKGRCFAFFSRLSLLMCVNLFFYLPELKGLTVVEIQKIHVPGCLRDPCRRAARESSSNWTAPKSRRKGRSRKWSVKADGNMRDSWR